MNYSVNGISTHINQGSNVQSQNPIEIVWKRNQLSNVSVNFSIGVRELGFEVKHLETKLAYLTAQRNDCTISGVGTTFYTMDMLCCC